MTTSVMRYFSPFVSSYQCIYWLITFVHGADVILCIVCLFLMCWCSFKMPNNGGNFHFKIVTVSRNNNDALHAVTELRAFKVAHKTIQWFCERNMFFQFLVKIFQSCVYNGFKRFSSLILPSILNSVLLLCTIYLQMLNPLL